MPYGMHFHHVWLERAKDPRLPGYLRVAAVAYGRHLGNGHAPLGEGELAHLLGVRDPATGSWRANANVNRSIRTAIDYGLLAPGSSRRCLVVPINAIWGGRNYNRTRHVRCGEPHRASPMTASTRR
jgi:hypothetical protein